MEKLIDKINKYKSLHSEILEAFGETGWNSIEYHVSSRWHHRWSGSHGEMNWLDEYGTEYSFDNASQVGESVEGYCLFSIYDNGESFYAIFSDSMRFEDYEDYENEFGVEI